MNHFLQLTDISESDFLKILHDAIKSKHDPQYLKTVLQDKYIGLLFQKHSTRTKIAFDVAIRQMSGNSILLDSQHMQISRGEEWEDTINVLSQYLDGLVIRTSNHEQLEYLANFQLIPIINALSSQSHPCQAFADYMTIYEEFQSTEQKNICFLGDGANNVCQSLILGAIYAKSNIIIGSPKKYQPSKGLLQYAQKFGISVKVTDSPEEAVHSADVLYTDVWISMTDSSESSKEKEHELMPYQLNESLLKKTNSPQTIVLHCLPAYRGKEITGEIFHSPQSRIYKQAYNRLFSQKAILNYIFQSKQ